MNEHEFQNFYDPKPKVAFSLVENNNRIQNSAFSVLTFTQS